MLLLLCGSSSPTPATAPATAGLFVRMTTQSRIASTLPNTWEKLLSALPFVVSQQLLHVVWCSVVGNTNRMCSHVHRSEDPDTLTRTGPTIAPLWRYAQPYAKPSKMPTYLELSAPSFVQGSAK